MNDHDIVLEIQQLLDGTEWQVDMLEKIASLLDENGYKIRDIEA
jgi:hypothetical protein